MVDTAPVVEVVTVAVVAVLLLVGVSGEATAVVVEVVAAPHEAVALCI